MVEFIVMLFIILDSVCLSGERQWVKDSESTGLKLREFVDISLVLLATYKIVEGNARFPLRRGLTEIRSPAQWCHHRRTN